MRAGNLTAGSRPVTYITWSVRPLDGNRHHRVQLYFDADAEHCTSTNQENVSWGRASTAGSPVAFQAMRIGSAVQQVLGVTPGGSNHINWGYMYIAWASAAASSVLSGAVGTRQRWCGNGTLPSRDDTRMPRAVHDDWVVAAVSFDCGGELNACEHSVVFAYDDIKSVEYDHRQLEAYWRHSYHERYPSPGHDGRSAVEDDPTFIGMLGEAVRDVALETSLARAFDGSLAAELVQAGGEQYKEIAALTYRQTMAANVLVWDDEADGGAGAALHMSRECGSGDDILTMDVVIDSLPFFLHFNPEYIFGELRPILALAENATHRADGSVIEWRHPYTPHDMGKYPVADGYDGGQQETMPLEETGNLLVMLAAACNRTAHPAGRGAGSCAFAAAHWPTLRRWADYLDANGLFPVAQLSSDDFDGPLANRTNLAANAILGLGAFAQLARMQGHAAEAKAYRAKADAMAAAWRGLVIAADGRLSTFRYGEPESWGMLYRLWVDDLLDTGLFPAGAVKGKLKQFYADKTQRYGLPIDDRHDYTIQPWNTWVWSLSVYSRAEFEALFQTTYAWVGVTPSRWPLTDWYQTGGRGERVDFEARSMCEYAGFCRCPSLYIHPRISPPTHTPTHSHPPFPRSVIPPHTRARAPSLSRSLCG